MGILASLKHIKHATNNVPKFSILQLKPDLFVYQWSVSSLIYVYVYKGEKYDSFLIFSIFSLFTCMSFEYVSTFIHDYSVWCVISIKM